MKFQKRFLISLAFTGLITVFAQGQANGPYYISGPTEVCTGIIALFYNIQNAQTGGNDITYVEWIGSFTPTFQNGNYGEFVIFQPVGTYYLTALVHTYNGAVFQVNPITIYVVECSGDVELTSNAPQLCPTANIIPPAQVIPPADAFTVIIENAENVAVGDQLCLDIKVRNFILINGMQFTIHYDPADLQYQTVINYGLPGLAGVNFGWLPGMDFITVGWGDPNVGYGVTLPNDSTIFTICFTAISQECSTEVVFTNTPTQIDITNGNGESLPFTGIPGFVQFNGADANGGPPPMQTCCENICAGTRVKYTATLEDQAFSNFSWSVIGSSTTQILGDGHQIEVLWETPGPGSVSFTHGGANTSLCVNILPLPETSFSSNVSQNGDTLYVCRGQSVTFTNTTQESNDFEWNFGNGHSSTMADPTYAWPQAGTYQMVLIAYNECHCADTSSLTVIVLPTKAPDLTCRGTVCEGTAVTYTTDADCGTFIWTVSPNGIVTDGGGPTDNFIAVNWINGPEGIIQLQVENCADGDYCSEPNMLHVPVIDSDSQIEGPELACLSELAYYTLPSYGGVEYTWSVSSMGAIQSGQGTQTVGVQWGNGLSNSPQWVAVTYNNCYLDCGGTDTIWVNIRPQFYIKGPIEACLNAAPTYSARRSDTNEGIPCNWTVTDLAGNELWTSGNAANSLPVPWNLGVGGFRLIARPVNPDDYCLDTVAIMVQVRELPPPVTGISGEDFICESVNYNYNALGILPGNNVTWLITGNVGDHYVDGNPINVIWNSPIVNFKLTANQINSYGCKSPPTILAPMLLPALQITGDTSLCAGQTAVYSVADFDNLEYTWSVSPADAGTILNTLNSSSIEILWHKAGPTEIHLSVCGQNISLPVVIHPTPAPEVIHPDYLCPGETVQIQTAQGYAEYSWHNESGTTISNMAEPAVPYGYYQVAVTNEFGCTGDTRFKIEGYPKPDISVSTPDNAGLCPGDPPSTLYALDTEEGYTYQWYFNGNLVPDSTHVTYSTTQPGDYYVVVTDHNGCMGQSNIFTLGYYCGPMGGSFPGGYPGSGSGSGGIPSDCEPNTFLQFQIQSTAACNQSNYTIVAPTLVPGSQVWNFGDPDSGTTNTSILANPSHTFGRAGFFQIILLGQVFNPGPVYCYAIGVDTVPLAANFYFEKACAGDAVNFFDASTFLPIESIASWQWDFGDPASGTANTSMLKDPMHVYQTAGAYNVTLTVTAASGCTATITQQVEVFPLPSVHFEPPGDHCAASASVFVANVSANVIEVLWNFGDPGSGAADTSDLFQPFHRYEAVGTYTTTLQGTTIYGCKNDFSRDIPILPNTLAGEIDFTSPICQGDTTLLTAPPGGTHWLWSTGDTTGTILAWQEGIYALTVFNENGCAYQPEDAVLRVNHAPQNTIHAIEYDENGLPTNYVYDTISVCAGEDVFLEVNDQSGQSYQWGNGQSGPTLEFSEERNSLLPVGDHEIFISVTDTETSCSTLIGPFVITVHPLPDMPVIAASPGGLVCEGTEVALSVNNPQASVSYLWSSGASGTAWETSQAGQHYVTATNEWGCTNSSDPYTILAGPNINLIPSGCHTRCRPDTLCFPTVPNIASYQWYFNGQAQGPAVSTVPEIVIAESGEYYLQMVTNDGCSLSSDPLTLDLFDGYGNITGQVYWDRNNNGILDPADSLLTGIPFFLLLNDMAIDTVLSQTGGNYGFTNILSTNYGLQLDVGGLPPGLVADTTMIDTALLGCDVAVLVNWRLRCVSSTGSLTLNACGESTVDYNGTPLMAGTVTDFSYTNALGCDSLLTVTVLASSPSFTTLTFNTCTGNPIDYNGAPLLPGTSTDFTFTNTAGCDSVVTVMVTELSASAATLNLSACHGSTIDYNGAPLLPGTTTDFTYTNAVGCDSVITVTVAELMPSNTTLILHVCPGGNIDYQGITLTAGETADFTFTNAVGCDSIVNVGVITYSLPSYSISVLESCPNTPTGSIEVSGPDFISFTLGGANQVSGIFTGLSAGIYQLGMEDNNGCIQETQVQLNAFDPLQVAVENPSLPCNGEPVTLTVNVLSGDDGSLQFLWEDGTTTAERSVNTAGTYTLTAMNNCEVVTQPVVVDYVENPEGIPVYIPNAFSPNDDGINDEFKVFVSDEVAVLDFEILVFDRWGNQLYHSRDMSSGWDGFFRSKALNPGVYSWWIRANLFHCGDSIIINKKGEVTLIR